MAQTERIALLIDDDLVDRMRFHRALRESPIESSVIPFSSGKDALKYLTVNPDANFDVLFLDISMPSMDGFEFLTNVSEQFRNRFSNVDIVMMSASEDPSIRLRALKHPLVRRFINKPFTSGAKLNLTRHFRERTTVAA